MISHLDGADDAKIVNMTKIVNNFLGNFSVGRVINCITLCVKEGT